MEAEAKELREKLERRKEGKMPPGLTGHVLAINSDYNFVVIDVGENQGVVSSAQMIVYRDGVLLGKIKITSVEPSISVGDILPEWKKGEIQEGDTVIFKEPSTSNS